MASLGWRPFHFHIGVRLRTVLAVSFTTSLVCLFLLTFLLVKAYTESVTNLQQKAIQLSHLQAEALSLPLWNLDNDRIRQLLKAIVDDPDVAGSIVKDEDNKIVALYYVKDRHEALSTTRDILIHEGKSYRTIGTLELTLCNDSVWHALWGHLCESIIMYFIMILLLTISVLWALRFITDPLSDLSEAMQLYAKGKKNITLPIVSSKDELGILCHTFSEMKHRLDEFHQSMEDKVRGRTRELMQAKDAAEQANKVKSEFLAMMSHELRTPMIAILGMIEIATEDTLSETQRERLGVAYRSAKHLQTIIDDLLDYSSISNNSLRIVSTKIALSQCIDDVITVHEPYAREKNLSLISELNLSCPNEVIIDAVRLKQVLNNLISNGIKFCNSGGGVVLFVEEQSLHLNFSIIDSGIGISEDKLNHIFSSFSQGEFSLSRKYGGVGIGLSLANSLVKLLGGQGLTVKTKKGIGSTFSFSLPFTLPEKESEDLTDGIENNANSSKFSILLCEDNRTNQIITQAAIESAGHQITIAENGQIGLELLAINHFDLVLMDVQMPVLDGLSTTKAIRQREGEEELQGISHHIPIIALTANALYEDKKNCFDAGMDAFLAKPFCREELLALISYWVEKRLKNDWQN